MFLIIVYIVYKTIKYEGFPSFRPQSGNENIKTKKNLCVNPLLL